MPSKAKATYIFIDESGGFGSKFDKGSSKIILVGFGLFPGVEYKTHVDNTKKMVKTKSGAPLRELKFSDATHTTRMYLLNRLVECNGAFGCAYLDKTDALFFNYNHVEDCYNEMISDVVTRIIDVAQTKCKHYIIAHEQGDSVCGFYMWQFLSKTRARHPRLLQNNREEYP